jgi:undecaprenyl-phosphate galactose phosphotransferase/putative colanic acid biosynthesis UDP-glucose lipid carrier transferase
MMNEQETQTVLVIANLVWFSLVLYLDAYKLIRVEPVEKLLGRTFRQVVLHLAFIYTIVAILNYDDFSRLQMFHFYLCFLVELFVFRLLFLKMLKRARMAGYNFRRVVIVGANSTGRQIAGILSKDLAYGYRVLGYFDNKPEGTFSSAELLGSIADIQNYVLENQVHEIYIASPDSDAQTIAELTAFCEQNLIRIKFIPDFRRFTKTRKVYIDFYENLPVIYLRKEPLEKAINRLLKRTFDIVFSLLVLILLGSWLFPILILAVKLSSKGPVFFRQQRSGTNNVAFWCYKFRTMYVNDAADVQQAVKNDPRITPLGHILRKFNLDELPQVFNVLSGDMSVVGPRPHMLKHTDEYSALISNYLVRHFTRPGITGWAQCNGLRGETTEIGMMEKRVEFDIWYIENWSFLLDIKIIVKTVINMFRGDGQ